MVGMQKLDSFPKLVFDRKSFRGARDSLTPTKIERESFFFAAALRDMLPECAVVLREFDGELGQLPAKPIRADWNLAVLYCAILRGDASLQEVRILPVLERLEWILFNVQNNIEL